MTEKNNLTGYDSSEEVKDTTLTKDTTVAELIQKGLLSQDQKEVIELEDEATLLECAAFDPEAGRATSDKKKLEELSNTAPLKLLEKIKDFADSLLDIEDMSNDEIERKLQETGIRLPEFEKVEQ